MGCHVCTFAVLLMFIGTGAFSSSDHRFDDARSGSWAKWEGTWWKESRGARKGECFTSTIWNHWTTHGRVSGLTCKASLSVLQMWLPPRLTSLFGWQLGPPYVKTPDGLFGFKATFAVERGWPALSGKPSSRAVMEARLQPTLFSQSACNYSTQAFSPPPNVEIQHRGMQSSATQEALF